MWMGKKVSQCFVYVFILLALLLIMCAVVSVETLSYYVAVLMVSNQLCYNSGVDVAAALCVYCKEE